MKNDIYRKRLNKPMSENVLKFLSSLKDDLWIVEEDIIGTEVHNIMLYQQGILTRDEIKLILKSLEELKLKVLEKQFVLEENFEDIHPLIEKYIIDKIGIEIGGKIHTGRSRNDQVSVDIRLKIKKLLNQLSWELLEFIKILLELSKKTIHYYMPLYTHFQRGQLGTFAHYINYYIAQILRNLERIEELYKRINKNPLGACAIGGTSININRDLTTELLGFSDIVENSIDAISSRDYIIEVLSCISIISIQFSRIAEDLMIWSTKEFNFIEIDDDFCSVSSVMPQKKNPDSIELIRGKIAKILGNLNYVLYNVKAIPTGYFRDFQELKIPLRDSFNTILSIIIIFKDLFSSIKINKNKMFEAINDSYILAIDLAEFLVQNYSIPFRNAHEIVAELVLNSKSPKDLFIIEKIENIIEKKLGKKIKLPNDFLRLFSNFKSCLDKRVSKGSPSESEICRLIKIFEEKKEYLSQLLQERLEKEKNAEIKRKKLIETLIS
ncbi:MAG: argininosuccinate lyase [Promethearchaeia archaeon]